MRLALISKKYHAWEYEQEWRYYSHEPTAEGLYTDTPIPPEAIRRIFLGVWITPSDEAAIRRAASTLPNATIVRLHKSPPYLLVHTSPRTPPTYTHLTQEGNDTMHEMLRDYMAREVARKRKPS